MKNLIEILRNEGKPKTFGAIDIIKNIGPGLLVTVGFIDPGNWASNFAAGSSYGYVLLWVVTLSTIMLIALQHNVAHLGIVTGLCLSEATEKYAPHWIGRLILLFTNSYKRIERLIITFVSMIGLSFIYELFLVRIDWPAATQGWVVPSIPEGSMLIVMSVLGAVVMPHNLFLHSELVQSRQINKKDKNSIERALKFELFDTLFSMLVGWAINSAMIILAATTFFSSHQVVDALRLRLSSRLSWATMPPTSLPSPCSWRAFRVRSPVVWRQVVSSQECLASSIMPRMPIPLWESVSPWF